VLWPCAKQTFLSSIFFVYVCLFFKNLRSILKGFGSATSVVLGGMTHQNTMSFKDLTRRHGVKVESRINVEQCCLAVGEIVGHDHIVSASRMNSAIVIFFKTIEKANEVVQSGVVLDGSLVTVLPLSTPSKKVILSNVPPFIKDEILVQELSRYGKLVSPIKKIPLGCKSPLVKHLVSFRRQVFMVLKNGIDEIDLVFKFKIEGFDYTVFATSDTTIKCFSCGKIGHLVRDCSNKKDSAGASTSMGQGVSVLPPAEVASDTDTVMAVVEAGDAAAGIVVEAVETELGSIAPVKISDTTDIVSEHSKDVKCMMSEKSKHSENVCVTDADEIDVEDDVDFEGKAKSVFKIPVKRKKKSSGKAFKQVKKDEGGDDTNVGSDSDRDSSDSNVSQVSNMSISSQNESLVCLYSADDISRFLQETKGMKGVQVENFFPDCKQFINDARYLMKEGAFQDVEIYRLRKLVNKLKKTISKDDEAVNF